MMDLPVEPVLQTARDLLAQRRAETPEAETADEQLRPDRPRRRGGEPRRTRPRRRRRDATARSPPSATCPRPRAGEVFDAAGLTVLPGVIDTQVHFREPGLEWKEDLETGSPRRGAGRRRRRVRDAEHRAHHHRPGRPGRQAGPRPATACTATTPSTSAAPTRTPTILGELERLPGCCGVKVFMGASTGTLLVAGRRGRRAGAAPRQPPRRLPLRGRIPPGRAPRRWPAPATGPATRRCATPSSAIQSTQPAGAASPREAGQAHPRAARHHRARRSTSSPHHKDVATVEVTPQHLTLAGARGLRAAEGLRPDEPADPRRRAPRRACGAASTRASPTCWAPTTPRTPARRRPGPIRPRPRACRACRPWCR